MARRLGAEEPWLTALRVEAPETDGRGVGSLEGLDDAWALALRFAEFVAESGHAVPEAVVAQLGGYWDEGAVVEITLVAGLFSYFNRFNDALRVEVTREAGR